MCQGLEYIKSVYTFIVWSIELMDKVHSFKTLPIFVKVMCCWLMAQIS